MGEYWYWFLVAGGLLIIEMLTLTTFFLFFAVGSVLMGVITYFVPHMSSNLQLGLTAIFAVLAMLAGYYTFKSKKNAHNDVDNVNNRMVKHIGLQVKLLKDSKNGVSKITLGDTQWRALINNGKKDELVEIVDFKSTSFIVKKVT
jgi:membrane protein implicated in regulation of membrane protease activity